MFINKLRLSYNHELATIGDKISWNFSPEKGLLTFYDFKRENKAFPAPSLPYNVVPLFELKILQ